MDGELVLKVLNVPVLLGWAAMVLAPRARFTRWVLEAAVRLVTRRFLPAIAPLPTEGVR